MINEYLCSNFIAEQILDEIVPNQVIERRMGISTITDKKESKDPMLYDQGSSGYQNWLSKYSIITLSFYYLIRPIIEPLLHD